MLRIGVQSECSDGASCAPQHKHAAGVDDCGAHQSAKQLHLTGDLRSRNAHRRCLTAKRRGGY